MSRPNEYAPEIAQEVCKRLQAGPTLREVCRAEYMPAASTVRLWVQERPDFAEQYARARELGYLEMADEVLEIADDGTNDWIDRQRQDGSTERVFDSEHYQRSKLRYEARRWLLSKCLPKIYGDKLELAGQGGGPLQIAVVRFTDAGGQEDGK